MNNDFHNDLDYSHSKADEPWWEEVYRRAFKGFDTMSCVRDDGWAQRGGIDRVVVLSSGKTLYIDEKVRREHWDDILLERWSDADRRKPGWVQKDLACDYIAYAFEPTRVCHLLPFQQLRTAWVKNGRDWIGRYRHIRAKNTGYHTLSVAVPTDVLMKALADAMTVRF